MIKVFKALCKKSGLPEPVAEYQFHPKRKWRVDYYFEHEGRKVALEVEGGIYQYGRHNRAAGFIKDMEKYNELSVQGIYLLRVLPKNLLKMKTIELISKILFE